MREEKSQNEKQFWALKLAFVRSSRGSGRVGGFRGKAPSRGSSRFPVFVRGRSVSGAFGGKAPEHRPSSPVSFVCARRAGSGVLGETPPPPALPAV
mgnify:FL=1